LENSGRPLSDRQDDTVINSTIPIARAATQCDADGRSSTGSSLMLLGLHRSETRLITTSIEFTVEDKIVDWFIKNDSFESNK
jgi:poly-beta-hydroxyalkanoate depolymerase